LYSRTNLVLEYKEDSKFFKNSDVGDSLDVQDFSERSRIMSNANPDALFTTYSDKQPAVYGS
jgi:hypothetical protein